MSGLRTVVVTALLLGAAGAAQARLLLTEETTTAGRLVFDANIRMSVRQDWFGEPEAKYQTVRFPWQARLGVTSRFDVGFLLDYANQRLDQGAARYEGSSNELFSTFVKYSPWNRMGFLLAWHARRSEQGDQELPIGRGDDIEAIVMFSVPTGWPLMFNAGYIRKEPYSSKYGIPTGQPRKVAPGDIWQLKAAMQIPLPAHFSILNELAYYDISAKSFDHVELGDSAGEAMDALIGLSWDYENWYLTGGASFGLLDETHTSFDIQRGAGDVNYHFRIGYRLLPHKAVQ
jgi:hypothetical protein